MNILIKKKIELFRRTITQNYNKKNEEKFLQSIEDYWKFLNNFRNLSLRFYDDSLLENLTKKFYKKKIYNNNLISKKNFVLGAILVNKNDTGGASELKRFLDTGTYLSGKKVKTKVLVLHTDMNKYKNTNEYMYSKKKYKSNLYIKNIKNKKQTEKLNIVIRWIKKNKVDFCFVPNYPFVIASLEKCQIPVYGVLSQDHHAFTPFPNIGDISFYLCNDQIYKYKTKSKNFLITGLPKFEKKIYSNIKPFKKSKFNIPKNFVVSATTNLEKCLIGGNKIFLNLISKVLRRNKNYVHIFLGTSRCKEILDNFIKSNKDLSKRLIYIGPVKNIFNILKMIDFYINSFPISGGTSIECGFIKKPSVDFIWDRDLSIHPIQIYSNPSTTVYNDQDFELICNKLISSKTYRLKQGSIAYTSLKHFDDNKQIYRKIVNMFLKVYLKKIGYSKNTNHTNLLSNVIKKETKKRIIKFC